MRTRRASIVPSAAWVAATYSAPTSAIVNARPATALRVGLACNQPSRTLKPGFCLRKLMTAQGLPAPPVGRTLESICITEACE